MTAPPTARAMESSSQPRYIDELAIEPRPGLGGAGGRLPGPGGNRPGPKTTKRPDPPKCKVVAAKHDTTIRSWTATDTITCDGNVWPQPCLHYSSVQARPNGKASVLSCPYPMFPKGKKIPRPEVNSYRNAHTINWNSYMPVFATQSNGLQQVCDIDEYPPAYFMQNVKGKNWRVDNQTTSVYVRYVPADDNRSAGQLWKGFCDQKTISEEVSTGPTDAANRCTATTTSHVLLRAMTMAFENMPNLPDAGILDNPCLPKAILKDPGFALMADDPWYDKNGKKGDNAGARASRYSKEPEPKDINGVKPVRSRLGPGCQWKRGDGACSEDLIDPNDESYEWPDVPEPSGLGVNIPRDVQNIEENNGTLRERSAEELFEDFGLLKCDTDDCVEEWASIADAFGYDVSDLATPTGYDWPYTDPETQHVTATPAALTFPDSEGYVAATAPSRRQRSSQASATHETVR